MSENPQSRQIDPRIVVLEARPYWGPELQREFQDTATEVLTCDRIDRADAWLDEAESALMLWDFVADRSRTLQWLGLRARSDRAPRVIVCSEPVDAAWEWLLRSCGVVSWSSAHKSTAELALLCRRWIS